MELRIRTLAATVLAAVLSCEVSASPKKRALLIGINDYSASRLPATTQPKAPERDWSNLDGTGNDVKTMHELLTSTRGFSNTDIETLIDHRATRAAILDSIERHLLRPAQKDDVVLFYYSGHGSQVRNSLSSEDDKLDESLVPADSRRGAPDIRDKELRALFNRILDRGAQLTVILDACHSGSGARGGLDAGLRHRGIRTDERDVRDRTREPEPEERGGLVLSAAQDFDQAYETRGPDGEFRGAFTWAIARAMRDANPGESASEIFLRAQARLRAEMPSQDPVLAGRREERLRALLGERTDRRNGGAAIAVESIARDGTYTLHGGWANGLTVGSELRLPGHDDVRLEVTALVGLGRSQARRLTQRTRGTADVQPGALLELSQWAAPPGEPLRVWIPTARAEVLDSAHALRAEASRRGIRWLDDPITTRPTHVIRWSDNAWQLVTPRRTAPRHTDLLAHVPRDASLFVQLPATTDVAKAMTDVDGVMLVNGPEAAHYILAGRATERGIEYAWVRPNVTCADAERTPMPLHTRWTSHASDVREALTRLRRVHGWHHLQSPAANGSHYELALRRASDRTLVEDRVLTGETTYRLVLRARAKPPAEPLYPRYVYVFVIDSEGRSVLLFPREEYGSVENRLPQTRTASKAIHDPPQEIELAASRPFRVTKPYGLDTYFLLTTDEPLPTPTSLQWDGVRGGAPTRGGLEELLALTLAGTRTGPMRVPPNWSIDRVVFESIPPRRAS